MREWSSYSLGSLFDFSNGVNTDKSAYGSGVPFANVLEVITNESLTEELIPGRVRLQPSELRRYEVLPGDVLFNRTSETPDEVGLASTFVGHGGVVFGGFVLRGRPKSDVLDVSYSKYALRAADVRAQIVARGQGGIRANIGQRDLATVVVRLPELSEQIKVAEALDDASALVSSVRRLLAKKRNLAQGMVRALISGRDRLPGYSNPWTTFKLGSRADVRSGGTPSTFMPSFWGGDIKWMSSGEVHLRNVYDVVGRITQAGLQQSSARLLPPNTVLVALAGQGRTRGSVAISRVELATNQSLAGVIAHETLDPDFLYYNLSARYLELRGGSAGDGGRGGLNLTALKELNITAPELDEQRAISRLLRDVDAEISVLEQRLVSAESVKVGMSQKLLRSNGDEEVAV